MLWCEQLWTREKRAYRREIREERRDEEKRREVAAFVCFGQTPQLMQPVIFTMCLHLLDDVSTVGHDSLRLTYCCK